MSLVFYIMIKKYVCWICEKDCGKKINDMFIILDGENHSTLVCNKCKKKLKEGKNLTYKKII